MGCGFVHCLAPALVGMRARAWCRVRRFAAQLALAGVVRASHRTVVTGLRRMLEIAWHVLHDDVVIEAVGDMRVVMNRLARTRFGELLVGRRIERLVAALPFGEPGRSEESRVGKGVFSTCRTRGYLDH